MKPDAEWLFDASGNKGGWVKRQHVDGAQPPPGWTDCDNIPTLYGYNSNIVDPPSSIVSLCPGPLNRNIGTGSTISGRVNVVYAPNQLSLNQVVTGSTAMLLFHELSHAKALFGEENTGRL